MLEQIKKILSEKGIVVYDDFLNEFKPSDDFWDEQTEDKLSEFTITDGLVELAESFEGKSVAEFCQLAEKEGFADQQPKLIIENDDMPLLKLQNGAYLSWFRGYRMQVSGDTHGGGDYGSSDTTMAFDIGLVKGNNMPIVWQKLVLWSHVVQAVMRYRGKMDQVPNEMLNKFMVGTAKYDRTAKFEDFDLKDLEELIKPCSAVEMQDAYAVGIVRVLHNKRVREQFGVDKWGEGDTVMLGDNFVSLGSEMIQLPDMRDEEGDEILSQDSKKALLYRAMFVLLYRAGYNASYMDVYKMVDEPSKPVEEGIKVFKDMRDVYDCMNKYYKKRQEEEQAITDMNAF